MSCYHHNQGLYSPTILKNILCLFLKVSVNVKVTQLLIGLTTLFSHSEVMLLSNARNTGKSGEQDEERSSDWLMNTNPEFCKLNPFSNKPRFLHVCSTSLLKTLWEKEKLLVMRYFSFSHSVFYPFEDLSAVFFKFEIVICKLFQFGRV